MNFTLSLLYSQLLAYISSQSSEDEDVKVRESCHGDNTRPLDQMSMETWDQDNLLLTNEEIFLAYWKISVGWKIWLYCKAK